MATEDNEILRNRGPIQVPIAVRDETYNTVRDVEDKVRLENELYQRQRDYTEYMEKHPEAVDAEINRINAELQHDLNLLYSKYYWATEDHALYNKLTEDRKQSAKEQIEKLPGYNVWVNWKYGPNGAVLAQAPESYGQDYNQVTEDQSRIYNTMVQHANNSYLMTGNQMQNMSVDTRNPEAVNSYFTAGRVANVDAPVIGALTAMGGGTPLQMLTGGVGAMGGSMLGSEIGGDMANMFGWDPNKARFWGGFIGAIPGYSVGRWFGGTRPVVSTQNAIRGWASDRGATSVNYPGTSSSILGRSGEAFTWDNGQQIYTGYRNPEYAVSQPLEFAGYNVGPAGYIPGSPGNGGLLPRSTSAPKGSLVAQGTAKGTGRLNGNRVTIDGKEYVIEVNPDGTAILTGNDGAQSVVKVTSAKTNAARSTKGNRYNGYQDVAQDVEFEIIDDSQGMLTGGNSGVPQTVPGSRVGVDGRMADYIDDGQLFQYIDNSGQRNIGPYSKIMQIAEREGNPYAVSRYTSATEASAVDAGVDAGALRGNGVNPATGSGNNVPGAPTRTGNVPAVYNPGRSGSVPAPRPGNGNNAAAQTTIDDLINRGIFTNNSGNGSYSSQGSMYTRTPHIFGPRQVESITIEGVEFRPVNGNGRVVTLEGPDGRIVDLPIENLNSQNVRYTVNYGPRRMFVRTPPNSRYYAFGKVADPSFTTTPWFVNNPTSVWMPQTRWQTTYRPLIYGGAALAGGYFGGRKLGFWGGDDEDSRSIYEQLEENYRNGTSDGTLFDGNVEDTIPRNANPDETVIVDDSLALKNTQNSTGNVSGTGGTNTVGATVSTQLPSDTLGYTNDPNAAAEFDIMMEVAQQVVNNVPNSDFSKRYKQMMAEGKSDDEIISYITSWWNSEGRAQYTVPAQ